MKRSFFALLSCVFLSGGVASLLAVDRVPVATFAKPRDFYNARLSPDGKCVAFLKDEEGKTWLHFLDLEKKKLTRVDPGKTLDGLYPKEVAGFDWISDKRVAFITTVWEGQYWTGMTAVDRDGQNWKGFTGYEVEDEEMPLMAKDIIYTFNDKTQSVLMSDEGWSDDNNRVFPDVVRVNTLTAGYKVVVKNPGDVVGWGTDGAGVVRLGIKSNGLKTSAIYRETEAAPWKTLTPFAEERGRIYPLGFHPDGKNFVVTALSDSKRWSVYFFDPETETLEDVASHEEYDLIPPSYAPAIDGISLAGAVFTGTNQYVAGVRYVTEVPKVDWFDPNLEAIQTMVDRMLPNTANIITSWSNDMRKLLVMGFSDRDPGSYYLIDLAGEKPKFILLAHSRKDFPVEQMASRFAVSYPSRDGKTIRAYLTLPVGAEKKNLPFVVMPHGGPKVRDFQGFDLRAQFLANRGYAVLQMNYRGSPGYGQEFYKLGKREIGKGVQDDIEDGTRWVIDKGLADPKRIAIMGGSYGGYSALFALGKSPDMYRCGISICGVTDWAAILEGMKTDYKFSYAIWVDWIGKGKPEKLRAISPVAFADLIKAPVLMFQGKVDRIVPPDQADKMQVALKKAGNPAQLTYYSGEGHGFTKEKNLVDMYTKIETFLAQHLGPGVTAIALAPTAP